MSTHFAIELMLINVKHSPMSADMTVEVNPLLRFAYYVACSLIQ